MARKKDMPQKAALRELMSSYMKENNIKIQNGTDVNSIMRDMMSVTLEGALDEEFDQEFRYSKCDYHNKGTDNNRNGHSQKTIPPVMVTWNLTSQEIVKVNSNHRS